MHVALAFYWQIHCEAKFCYTEWPKNVSHYQMIKKSF